MKKKVLRIIKDYQSLIIYIISVSGVLSISLKPIRQLLGRFFGYTIQIKVWPVITIFIVTGIVIFFVRYTRRKMIAINKFKKGQEVRYKGDVTRMIVIGYKPLRNEVICSWVGGGEQKKGNFDINTLEEYKEIKLTPRATHYRVNPHRY